MTVDVLR